jgi:hypothetical protein
MAVILYQDPGKGLKNQMIMSQFFVSLGVTS